MHTLHDLSVRELFVDGAHCGIYQGKVHGRQPHIGTSSLTGPIVEMTT